MSAFDSYSDTVRKQLEAVCSTQRGAIEQAATWLADALANDRGLYAFGTGHSHMMAEEIFYRAGGLAHAVPILDPKLMLHESASKSTDFERLEGYAERLLQTYPVGAGDVLIIASNSGRNAVPVELAFAAKARGLKTVALTNFAHSRDWPSRHKSGKNLSAVADLAIDNCGISGDACVNLPGLPSPVGPTSTVMGALIVNLIVVQAIENALARGVTPETYISSNCGGDDHNNRLMAKYRSRIRHL